MSSAQTYEELSCQELVELVTDYLDGALPPELRDRFDQHLDHCSGCRAYLEQMQATITIAGRLTSEAITPEAERALLDAFRGWTRN
jgi:anti-sigma factor RsiW